MAVDCVFLLFFFCLFYRDFAKSITRPFSVYFNPYTQSIEILKDTRSIENVVQDLRSDLNTVCDALNKMNQYLGKWTVNGSNETLWVDENIHFVECDFYARVHIPAFIKLHIYYLYIVLYDLKGQKHIISLFTEGDSAHQPTHSRVSFSKVKVNGPCNKN